MRLKRFCRNNRAVAAMVIALVIGLVTISVVLGVGLMLQSNLGTALSVVSAKTNTTTTGQNITYDTFENVYSAYSLSAIVPLIAAAGLIITIIVIAFAAYGRRR